jgi:hypothetical protein
MQLVAYGAQDVYLTGNPQITFFKVVYRRHTNFSMESIEQTINGSDTLTSSSTSGTVTVARNGDLVSNVYVTSSTDDITDGDSIITDVALEIGGQQIDKHYTEWNQIWAELTTPESKALAFKNMTGALSHGLNKTGTAGVGHVQVPLHFWFCRNPGLALPLIALQYHEVKLKFTWGTSTAVGGGAVLKVYCDYIYLDTDERRRFAQVSHEYLIEQVQKQSATATTSTKLNFNHPVKEIIWTSAATNAYSTARLTLNGHDRMANREEEYYQLQQPYQYHTAVPGANIPMSDRPVMVTSTEATNEVLSAITTTHASAAGSAATMALTAAGALIFHTSVDADLVVGDVLLLNNSETDADAAGSFSQILTVTAKAGAYTYTVNGGAATVIAAGFGSIRIMGRLQNNKSRCSQFSKKINVYSFALNPEEHQPSGTCNFSRIDAAHLKTDSALAAADNIYAVNYNVLRVMSGMGGLAYSN